MLYFLLVNGQTTKIVFRHTFIFELQLNLLEGTNFSSLSVLGFVNHTVGTLSQCLSAFVFLET